MKNTARKSMTLEDYLALSYPVTLYPEAEGGFTAEIKALPGCMTQGETVEEAYAMIEDARQGWLTVAFERGMDIPMPGTEQDYSGKFVLRVPRSLHRQLSEGAEREGSSLNSYVTALLAQQVVLDSVLSEVRQVGRGLRRVEHRVEQHLTIDAGFRLKKEEPLAPDLARFAEYAEGGFAVRIEGAISAGGLN